MVVTIIENENVDSFKVSHNGSSETLSGDIGSTVIIGDDDGNITDLSKGNTVKVIARMDDGREVKLTSKKVE